MSKHTLEQHRFFPVIAWTLCIGFSLFVYNLTRELIGTTSALGERVTTLEIQSKQSPQTILELQP